MLPEKSSCLREKNNALKEYNQLFVDLKKNKDLWLKCFCKPGENKEKKYEEWMKILKFLKNKKGEGKSFLNVILDHLRDRFPKYKKTRKQFLRSKTEVNKKSQKAKIVTEISLLDDDDDSRQDTEKTPAKKSTVSNVVEIGSEETIKDKNETNPPINIPSSSMTIPKSNTRKLNRKRPKTTHKTRSDASKSNESKSINIISVENVNYNLDNISQEQEQNENQQKNDQTTGSCGPIQEIQDMETSISIAVESDSPQSPLISCENLNDKLMSPPNSSDTPEKFKSVRPNSVDIEISNNVPEKSVNAEKPVQSSFNVKVLKTLPIANQNRPISIESSVSADSGIGSILKKKIKIEPQYDSDASTDVDDENIPAKDENVIPGEKIKKEADYDSDATTDVSDSDNDSLFDEILKFTEAYSKNSKPSN